MSELCRAFEIDFDKVSDDGTIVCSIFDSYRPMNISLWPRTGESVAIYDDETSMWGQVLWASGTEVEIELLHD